MRAEVVAGPPKAVRHAVGCPKPGSRNSRRPARPPSRHVGLW
jgi:hypothetical protein